MFTKLLSCIICDSDDQNTSGPERRENHGTLTEICAGRRRAGNGRTDSDHRCNLHLYIEYIEGEKFPKNKLYTRYTQEHGQLKLSKKGK